MDILWTAVGISVIVAFVFYVLASHWARTLRKHSAAIRKISDRVQLMATLDDPQFRERISESVPPPLEDVFTFSFHFSEHFWPHTLHLSDLDWEFVRTFGCFVASVKLERWRSHTVATITEVLPTRRAATWQTRSLQYYPLAKDQYHSLTLWELPLSRPGLGGASRVLNLALRGNCLELRATGPCFETTERSSGDLIDRDEVLFRAPLDSELLREFRTEDPANAPNGNGNGNGAGQTPNAVPWQAFYAWHDERRGLEWHLHLRNLRRKSEWDRWKILESAHTPMVRNGL